MVVEAVMRQLNSERVYTYYFICWGLNVNKSIIKNKTEIFKKKGTFIRVCEGKL